MENEQVVYPRFRWFVAFAVAWAWITFGVVTITFAPLLHAISKDFHQPIGSLVIYLFAFKSLAGGFAIIFVGPLVDRFGPRQTLLWSSILTLLYCLLIPFFSHNVGQLSALNIFERVAEAPLFSSLAALTRRWFPPREQGTIIGLNNGMFAVGAAFLFLMVPWLMQVLHGDWRMVATLTGVMVAIQLILMIIVMFGKEPVIVRHAPPPGVAVRNDFKIALGLPVFWFGAVLLALGQGIMQAVTNTFPSFLSSPPPLGLGWNMFASGHTMLCVQIGMMVSGVLMGFLLNTIFRGNVKWFTALSFIAVGLVIVSLCAAFTHNSRTSAAVTFFFVGFMMNLAWPLVATFITANYPPHILGKVFATSSGICIWGGTFVSAGCGIILNMTHNYAFVFLFVLVLGIISCILAAITLNPVKAYKDTSTPTKNSELAAAGK